MFILNREKLASPRLTIHTQIAYLHAADRTTPFQETLEAMDKLHKAGKIKRLGLSNFSAYEVAEVAMICKYHGWLRPTIYQGLYNCLGRGVETELLAACKRYGLDFVAYAPSLGGILSGAYKSPDEVPTEGRFSDKFFGGQLRKRYFSEKMFKAVGIAREAIEKAGINGIEASLRWIVHHSKLDLREGNDGIIIGVSKLEHLESNLDALMNKGPLPTEVVEALDQAWEIVQPMSTQYWHGDLEYQYDTKEVLFGQGTK
jgi:aflatoxin B1 aldehyde reductase